MSGPYNGGRCVAILAHETVHGDIDSQLHSIGLSLDAMQEAIDRARVFVNDVMPQVGGLCLQDLGNLNELDILLQLMCNDDVKPPETVRWPRT